MDEVAVVKVVLYCGDPVGISEVRVGTRAASWLHQACPQREAVLADHNLFNAECSTGPRVDASARPEARAHSAKAGFGARKIGEESLPQHPNDVPGAWCINRRRIPAGAPRAIIAEAPSRLCMHRDPRDELLRSRIRPQGLRQRRTVSQRHRDLEKFVLVIGGRSERAQRRATPSNRCQVPDGKLLGG
jgi:hypothetical protein